MTRRFGRRAGLLALLAGLSACAQPEPPAPVVTAPADPEPERVYAPGPIAWADLSEEHKRRARAGLERMGEDAPDDDETLQARWMIMSPAQQRFLIRRPLLQALQASPGGAPVLLIDELDRADEAFEAYLLEVLADNQVTVPELGTIRASEPPIVVVTTNRTREIHDALKRRCLYHWVGYPDRDRELAILRSKVPGAGERLSKQVVAFVQALRGEGLFKSPGVAETLDWAAALVELDQTVLEPTVASDTLGVLLKYQDDIARLSGSRVKALVDAARAEAVG